MNTSAAAMISKGILLGLMVATAVAASLPSNYPNQNGRVRRSLPEEELEPQAWFSFSGTHTMGMDSGMFFAKDQGMVKDHR